MRTREESSQHTVKSYQGIVYAVQFGANTGRIEFLSSTSVFIYMAEDMMEKHRSEGRQFLLSSVGSLDIVSSQSDSYSSRRL
jgi:hypothetical protein